MLHNSHTLSHPKLSVDIFIGGSIKASNRKLHLEICVLVACLTQILALSGFCVLKEFQEKESNGYKNQMNKLNSILIFQV